MASVEQRSGETRVHVRIQPKSSRDAVIGERNDRIKVCLTASPVDGEANRALKTFMAKRLGIAKSSVTLHSGHRSRDKTLVIAGMPVGPVRAKLLGDQLGETS